MPVDPGDDGFGATVGVFEIQRRFIRGKVYAGGFAGGFQRQLDVKQRDDVLDDIQRRRTPLGAVVQNVDNRAVP